MEHSSHGYSDDGIVGVERCRVLCTAGWSLFLGGSEKGFDRLISEDDQCDYRLEAGRAGLIAPGLADALHDLLAAELLQVARVRAYWVGV